MPKLGALRAFEAAARRGSFKDAAQELSVTPGAISQQIKMLEDDLGVALFKRATRSVTLTEAGRLLQPDVTEGFMKLRDAVDGLRESSTDRLKICAAGMIIRNWLLPRLHTFTAQHPATQIQLHALHSWDAFDFGETDVAIRLAKTPPTGIYARKLHSVVLVPLATPEFIEKHQITGPEDAYRLPLLDEVVVQIFEGRSGWEKWFAAAGLPGPVPEPAMTFERNSAGLSLDMALAGKGITLGWSIQCFDALADGRLRCPFGPIVELDHSYFLMCRKSVAKKSHVRAFMDWAEKEAAMVSTMRSLQPGAA